MSERDGRAIGTAALCVVAILAGAGGAALTQDMLDDLLRAVPGANAVLCGDGGHQLLTKLLRADTQVNTMVDAFGR